MAVSAENKWIVGIAQKNPMLALVAALLVGISATCGVIGILYNGQMNGNNKQIKSMQVALHDKDLEINRCREISAKQDSIYTQKIFDVQQKANDEIQAFMNKIIEEQKVTIKEQDNFRRTRTNIYTKSQNVFKQTENILSNIKDNEKQ